MRTIGFGSRGFVEYHDLAGLEGDELDALIARQVRAFAERGERFEWKLHGHDRPADLPDRLRAAGLVPEEQETVVIGRVDEVAAEPGLPERRAYPRGAASRTASRGSRSSRSVGLATTGSGPRLGRRTWPRSVAADPEGLRVFLAEAGELAVCAGWVRFPSGTEFATLWGGATLPAWRGRGIYRALVAHRARLAAERGRRYVQVDASDDSRPILERLGFVAVTTTTPYVWSPSARESN